MFVIDSGVAVAMMSAVAAAVAAAAGVRLALYPFVPRDLGGAPNLDGRARRLRIPVAGNDAIDAWHLEGTRDATVIVLHGYGRDHHRAWRYGDFLNRAGYGVVTFDFRSSRDPAGGRRLPTTLGHHELPDARAVMRWIESRPEFADHALAVLGESLGGSIALMIAAETPRIVAIVADCPFSSGLHALEDSAERWARVPRWPAAPIARAVGRAFTGFDPGIPDAIGAARLLADRPVYFIHCGKDNRLAPAQVTRLWEAAGAKDPLWLLADAGHNEAWRLHTAEYEERVTRFLDEHLALGTVAETFADRASDAS